MDSGIELRAECHPHTIPKKGVIMTKINYDSDGKILAIGEGVIGKEIDTTILPEDFFNTFALGKYKAQEDADGSVTITEVPGFIMPEKDVYTVAEIQNMNKDELLDLQLKLQAIIEQKTAP